MNQKNIRLSTISKGPQNPRFRLTNLDKSTIYLKNSQKTQLIQTEPQEHIMPETVLQSSSNNVQQLVQQLNPEQNTAKNTNIQLINLSQQTDHDKSKKIKVNRYYESINAAFSLKHINFKNQLSKEQYQKITSSFEYSTNIELSRKKTVLKQKQAEEDCKIYKNGCWSRTKLMLTEDKLSFFQLSFQIKDLQKVKILPSINISKNKAENIIKVVVNDKVHLFSLSLDKKAYQVPISYYIFSKLIEKRIYQNEIPQWQKSQSNRQNCDIKDSYIYGNILKKSQHFGKWESRFIVIKNNGIYSYKNSNQQQKFSFFISRQSIKYFWTRFEKLDNFLIIKIKHGIFKTQFGIPLTQYSIRSTSNWLYAFYRALPIIETVKNSPIK